MAKNYVIVTTDDGQLDDTNFLGPDEVELFWIDWYTVDDDPDEARNTLSDLRTALASTADTPAPDAVVGIINRRAVVGIIKRLEEIIAESEYNNPKDEDKDVYCDVCGEPIDECACDEDGDI